MPNTIREWTRFFGILSLAILLSMAWGGTSSATIHSRVATLLGVNEVPPNASPGFGTGSFLIDDVANTVTYHVEFSGLVAPETAAHIHAPAGPGVNAPVIIPLPLGSPKDGTAPTSAVNIAHILAGNSYVNVHSTVFPGGEIRGQLVEAPSPTEESTWGSIKNLYY